MDYHSFLVTNWQQLERHVWRSKLANLAQLSLSSINKGKNIKTFYQQSSKPAKGRKKRILNFVIPTFWRLTEINFLTVHIINTWYKRFYSFHNTFFPSSSFYSPCLSPTKTVKGTCVLFAVLVHDIQRVQYIQSTLVYLAEICRNLLSLRNSIDYFYAIQMGECPRYQMMNGPRKDHIANMLMSTTNFVFKDTSEFGSTTTDVCE